MKTLCSECWQDPCGCGKMVPVEPAPASARATGSRLDAIGAMLNLPRARAEEPDAIYRARIQLTVIFGVPHTSGIPGGAYLDKLGRRRGMSRYAGEPDEDYLLRMAVASDKGKRRQEELGREHKSLRLPAGQR